jgi:SAM-dependent methyltransferase
MTDRIFSAGYASHYDALYSGKDYDAECEFIEAVIDRGRRPVRDVLDIGCGTGGHAIRLAQRGYRVVGVDRSQAMLELARDKARGAGVEVRFELQDARSLDLGGDRFDAVVAMFAVMSYQTSNDDLAAVCDGVARHLRPGGLFCFDAWHGLGVLTDPPRTRVRVIDADGRKITRITEPEMHAAEHVVATRFHLVETEGDRIVGELDECHRMRFLFPQEIAYFLTVAGFAEVTSSPFLALDEPLDETCWQLAVAAVMPERIEP